MRRVWLAGVLLALVFAACGSNGPDRFDLVTPGAHTGSPPAPTPVPSATPAPARKPVTKTEKRVIKGWSDSLRHGKVTAATRYFAVPSLISNGDPDWIQLSSRNDVHEFNRTLPCGAKLIRTRRSVDDFVVGIFRLTERPGAGECGTGTGNMAAVAFLIKKQHITRWVRVAEDQTTPLPSPSATPSPVPSATPEPSATATPDATDPSATATPDPSATATPAPSAVPTPDASLPDTPITA